MSMRARWRREIDSIEATRYPGRSSQLVPRAQMDRYNLVLQFDSVDPLKATQVRAIGPGPAGQPGAWLPTTAEAVADWVSKYASTYDQPAVTHTEGQTTYLQLEPRPDVPATSGYCHPIPSTFVPADQGPQIWPVLAAHTNLPSVAIVDVADVASEAKQ